MPGDEYQFFMKRGACVMFKIRRVLRDAAKDTGRPVAAFFDHDGTHVPGIGQAGLYEGARLSPHLDTMLEAATQISAPFDHIRVDFILLHDRPALGELSYCTMNARTDYSTDALEQLARNAARLDPIPVA